jgi:hypothetical protein
MKMFTDSTRFNWNNISEAEREKIRQKLRISQLGPKNSNWKGGRAPRYYMRLSKEKFENDIHCQNCGLVKKLDVHHMDGNHYNNDPSNLLQVCRHCHMLLDGRWKNMVERNENGALLERMSIGELPFKSLVGYWYGQRGNTIVFPIDTSIRNVWNQGT